MKNKVLFIVLVVAFSFSACNNNANKKGGNSVLDDVNIEETKERINAIPAPNSLEIMKALNEAGAAYIYEITNDPSYVNNYLTLKQKAIALGIYSADLSYLITYNQQDVLGDYIKVVHKLIDELEIPSIEIKRIQDNISNQDSLKFLTQELFKKSNDYLNSSDKVDVALYLLGSSWIETVYLTEKIIEFSGNQKPLLKIILDNKNSLDKIVELLATKKNEESFSYIYESLASIQELFEVIIKNPNDKEPIEKLKFLVRGVRGDMI